MVENADPKESGGSVVVDASGWPIAALANIGNGHNGKFDKQKKLRYLELLSDGIGRIKASKDVGVHIVTVERHINKNQAFKDACSLAEMEADEEVENALFEAARSGNVAAAFGWLYNRRPDRWQDRRNLRTEISGPNGGAIQSESIRIDIGDISEALTVLRDAGAVRVDTNGHAPATVDGIYTA
jgi:hypothetical protein